MDEVKFYKVQDDKTALKPAQNFTENATPQMVLCFTKANLIRTSCKNICLEVMTTNLPLRNPCFPQNTVTKDKVYYQPTAQDQPARQNADKVVISGIVYFTTPEGWLSLPDFIAHMYFEHDRLAMKASKNLISNNYFNKSRVTRTWKT